MVLQIGHEAQVNAVAFSSDGNFVASCDESGAVEIREVASGDIFRSVRALRGAAWSIAFSGDGKNVAVAGSDGQIAVWDFWSGALRRLPREPLHETLCLAFTPNSQTLLVGGRERKNFSSEIRCFEVSSGKPLVTWKTESYAQIEKMVFSPDGSTLATSDDSNSIALRNPQNGALLKTLSGHFNGVQALAWSPDGITLLSGGRDSTARLWSALTGKLLRTWTAQLGDVTAVAWSPDGSEAWTLSSYGVRVWNARDGNALRSFREVSGNTFALAPDGKTFALAQPTSDRDVPARLGIFDSQSGNPIRIWSGYRDEINSVSFQSTLAGVRLVTGHGIVTGDDEPGANQYLVNKKGRPWEPQSFGVARVWNFQKGSLQNAIRDDENKISEVVLARDGQRILTVRDDSPAWWSASSGKLLKTLVGANQTIYGCAVARDGSTLATGDFDEKIRVWDLKTGRVRRALPTSGNSLGMAYALAWSRDGRVLFAGYSESGSGALCAWDAQSGKNLWKIAAHNADVSSLAVSPDGKFLASADSNGELQKRDAKTGKLLWRVRAHWLPVAGSGAGEIEDAVKIWALCWSPDGSTLATGGEDAVVKTWAARDGRLLQTLAGHGALVNSATFSPEGKTLLSSSDDGTIRFWNAQSGALRGTLRTLPGKLDGWIAWTADNFYDGSSNAENFIRWNDGKKLLPVNAFDKRRAGLLAELISAP